MAEVSKTDYTLQEVAFAYALCAERLVASDPNVLNTHFGTVPVLVHLLYQSLEISLKRIGRRFQLLGGKDPKGFRLYDGTHDVKALADAIQAGFPGYDFVALLSAAVTDDSLNANHIGRMLTSDEFEDTRTVYRDRDLGYASLKSFTIFSSHIKEWIKAVKDTAQNLEKFVELLDTLNYNPDKPPSNLLKKVILARKGEAKMASERTQYLYAAVADTQNTIRALDTKTNYLMVILLIPLAKLGAIYTKCEGLLTLSHPWTRWVFVPLTVIFVVSWCMAILAVFKTLTAIDDPEKHITGDHPRGSFYASKLFPTCFIDIFVNRKISSAQQHHQHLADAPKTDDEVASELAYEHMKLTYIKSLKMVRSRNAYAFSKCWLIAGGAIWLSWLVLL